MEIVNNSEGCLKKSYELFSLYLKLEKSVYKPLSFNEFRNAFVENSIDLHKYFIMDEETGAFVSGVHDKRNGKNFLSFIFVPLPSRRLGIATNLLNRYEKVLYEDGYENQTIEISFINPVNLPWLIPNTQKHEHPNAPGIDLASEAYIFFQNRGFRNFAYQNSYYLDLKQYASSVRSKQIEAGLKDKKIHFKIFQKNKMQGFYELLLDLDSEVWMRELNHEISEEGMQRPILVPVLNNKVYGFAGPLSVEKSGRGFFSGIAVHSSMRGRGVATVLFDKLCLALQAEGAEYMTLFTGESNPARKIYEASGFKVVKSWADMRKERR